MAEIHRIQLRIFDRYLLSRMLLEEKVFDENLDPDNRLQGAYYYNQLCNNVIAGFYGLDAEYYIEWLVSSDLGKSFSIVKSSYVSIDESGKIRSDSEVYHV